MKSLRIILACFAAVSLTTAALVDGCGRRDDESAETGPDGARGESPAAVGRARPQAADPGPTSATGSPTTAPPSVPGSTTIAPSATHTASPPAGATTVPGASPTAPPPTTALPGAPPTTQPGPPATTTPRSTCGEPSCAPRAHLPGWQLAFADDFSSDIAAGAFPNRFPGAPGGWGAYGEGWPDSSGRGRYTPSAINVRDGLLRLPLRTVAGTPRVAAAAPRVSGAPGPFGGQLYGRFAIRVRTDNPAPGYKFVALLWPDSDVWPRDGEIDFPEAELDGPVAAFTHFQGATRGNDQDAFVTGSRLTDWHTYVIEWTPTSVTYYVDGAQIGRSTSRIPSTVMHLVLQAETSLAASTIPPTSQAEVQVDWVAIWFRA